MFAAQHMPSAHNLSELADELPPCWINSKQCPEPRVDIPLRNQLFSALRRLPREQRALVADVGANDGLFSLNVMHLAEQVPPVGVSPLPHSRRARQPQTSLARRIDLLLIEPQRKVARRLREMAARYEGSEHWPVAAWTRDANLTLHVAQRDASFREKSVRSSLLNAQEAASCSRCNTYTVPAVDLASRLHSVLDTRRPALFLLKLDVEGAEYELVPHLLTSGLLCRANYILLEWHLNRLTSRSRLSGSVLKRLSSSWQRAYASSGCRAALTPGPSRPFPTLTIPRSGLALRHSISWTLARCPTPPSVAHEEYGDENLGLPVDGLAQLVREHNGTAPPGVSKSFAKRLRARRVKREKSP